MGAIRFDHYFLSSEVTEILHDLEAKHPQLMKVYSICKTPGGRDIWVVELTNVKTGPIETKSAFHVDGVTHAGEISGCMATVYFIDMLLERYGKDDAVTRLLDDCAVYAVPCISPDGMDTFITSERLFSAPRPYPTEEPDCGLHAKDIDGDGQTRLMRIKSVFGAWKESPEDPRFLVRRRPDDVEGDFYNVYDEGEYVGPYDGGHIKLARHKWGNNFNRNFPIGWAGDGVQAGAGPYPLSNPETKAMADYILARRNIASAVTCHTAGGIFLYPPGPIDPIYADPADVAMYRALAALGNRETGYDTCSLHRYDLKSPSITLKPKDFAHGAFDDWMYVEQGILATTIEIWNARVNAGIRDTYHEDDAPIAQTMDEMVDEMNRVLKWLDETLGKDTVKPWTKFEHPQFGEVEIGGIDERFCTKNPPPALLEKELQGIARYFLGYALAIPRLKITSIEANEESKGVYRVSALVANLGYMPTYGTKEAIAREKSDEISVRVGAPGGVLNAAQGAKIGHLEGYSADTLNLIAGALYYPINHEPCTKRVSWLVYGKPGDAVTVTASTPKAGTASASVTL